MIRTLTLLGLLFAPSAFAAELAGITVPDTAVVGGTTLNLNGMGLREKFFIDVYVGALYLPTKTKDATKVIQEDVPKRLSMHFIYNTVSKEKLNGAFHEGFVAAKAQESEAKGLASLQGMMETVHKGDVIVLDYVPGTGTTITVKGQKKGTIPGVGFMRALWGVYVGPSPPTYNLKAGLLGG